jgi:hypothetical protein
MCVLVYARVCACTCVICVCVCYLSLFAILALTGICAHTEKAKRRVDISRRQVIQREGPSPPKTIRCILTIVNAVQGKARGWKLPNDSHADNDAVLKH